MVKWRFVKVVFCSFLLVALIPLIGSHAVAAGFSYKLPIAYVGSDGIYVTDAVGDRPTHVISSTNTSKAVHQYSRPQWSPDGQHLVVSDTVTQQDGSSSVAIIEASSNSKQQVLTQTPLTISSSTLPVTWTWDGAQIAYFNEDGVFLLPAAGGAPKLLYKPQIVSGIGEASGLEDPAIGLANEEHEQEPLRTGYSLLSTSVGLLIGSQLETPDNGVDNWGLVSPDGKLVWSDTFSTKPVVSPDGTQALAGYAGTHLDGQDAPAQPGSEPVVLIDLKTGKISTPLQKFPPGAMPLAWQGQSMIYFGTQKQVETVDGDSAVTAPQPIFDNTTWPFTATDSELTLWAVPIVPHNPQPPTVFTDGGGYGLGVMTISTDLNASIVVTTISSSVAMVKAINKGSTGKAVSALFPKVTLYAFDSVPMQNTTQHAVKWKRDGGRPSYGNGSFIAVASN